MDKKIWLKVIRDELTLLDELATGMIGDTTLSREEVELAVSRSKIVVKEFEMLLNQISAEENVIKAEVESSKDGLIESPSPSVPPSSLRPSVVPSSPRPLVESPSPPVSSSDPIHDAPILQVSESPLRQAQGPESHTLGLDPSTGSGSTGVEFAPSPPPAVVESLSPPVPQSQSPSFGSPPPAVVESSITTDDRTEYAQHFKVEPMRSLKEGLSLNDRYLFQRELFNNDKSSLDDTIQSLDGLHNLREAVEYLKANFKWNKSDAADKFVALIKRRFSEPKGS